MQERLRLEQSGFSVAQLAVVGRAFSTLQARCPESLRGGGDAFQGERCGAVGEPGLRRGLERERLETCPRATQLEQAGLKLEFALRHQIGHIAKG